MYPKKQFFISFLMVCFMIASLQAQNYQINFTGSGLSTTIDSVQVLNILQGTSVTVKITEDLQLVGTSTDIESHLPGNGNLYIFPNPMTETSRIEFSISGESPVSIEVFDLTGKMIIRNKQSLLQGNHRFEISGLTQGIYMINLFTGDRKYSGKLISNGEHSGPSSIRYLGIINSSAQKSVLKSVNNLVQMSYNNGERLLLKGFSGNNSRVLTLIPTESQTVNFELVACTDADGKHYAVITIGTQTWMAENLAYLPSVSNPYNNSQTIPYYYVPHYQGDNVTEAKAKWSYQKYGVLYNWPAALNACPVGWHLPTDAEWTALGNFLIVNGFNYDGTTAGNKIAKSLTEVGGFSHTGVGTVGNTDYPEKRNATGFSATMGGRRSTGTFVSIGHYGHWWSATEYSSSHIWFRRLRYDYSGLESSNEGIMNYGFSVRCLRD